MRLIFALQGYLEQANNNIELLNCSFTEKDIMKNRLHLEISLRIVDKLRNEAAHVDSRTIAKIAIMLEKAFNSFCLANTRLSMLGSEEKYNEKNKRAN